MLKIIKNKLYCSTKMIRKNEADEKNYVKVSKIEELQEDVLDGGTKVLTKSERRLKWRILKDVVCISFSFTLMFTSYNSMSNLQSSIQRSMGTTALTAIYVGLVLSCLLLPSVVIRRLKPKWAIALAFLMYMPYLAMLSFPRYYTLIPTALFLGTAGAWLWAAKCTYLSKVAATYAETVGETFDVVIVRFFSIFFFFFQLSQMAGNYLSSAVLSKGVSNFSRLSGFLENCGSNFCPEFTLDDDQVTTKPSNTSQNVEKETTIEEHKLYIMTAIYMGLIVSAIFVVAALVNPLSRYGLSVKEESKSVKDLLLVTVMHMKNRYQLLITPLTIWSGTGQGLLSADYTASFVTCSIGLHMVGYAYLCFGVSDTVCTLVFAALAKHIRRELIFTGGAIINATMLVVMLTWRPSPDHYFMFFLIPTFWGMADAVWQTQINSLYGVIFPGEAQAAFSNYRLWESVGFIIAYVMSGNLCMRTKIILNIIFLSVGMTGYYIIEFMEKRRKNNEK